MNLCRLGYETLSHDERVVYDCMFDALISMSDTVDSSRFKKNIDLMKVLDTVIGDNPRLIHFDHSQLCPGSKRVRLCGLYSAARTRAMYDELERCAAKAIEEITLLAPSSVYEKLLYIYEYLQDHITYDEQELQRMIRKGSADDPLPHNAYGALVNGRAVCDGISAAFSLLAQRMDVESTMVSGSAAIHSSKSENHAWNLIRVNGKCYHVDLTWDINRKNAIGTYSYDYFCIDDSQAGANHLWDVRLTHPCNDMDLSYYLRNQCLAANLSQLEEIFLRYAKSKQRYVRTRLREGIAVPAPAMEYLGNLLLRAAEKAQRYDPFEYMWSEATRCFFAEFKP